MRIWYVGRDPFLACAEAVLDAGHTIAGFSSHNSATSPEVARLGRRLGLRPRWSPLSAREYAGLRQMGVDLVLSAGYPHKIPVEADPGLRAVNVHPMLLPEGRGPSPFVRVILDGLRTTGVTLHETSARWDHGPILLQREIAVLDGDTSQTLAFRLAPLAAQACRELLADFEALWDGRTPQTGGSYWKGPTGLDREVDWAQPVAAVERHLRAYALGDARATLRGERRRVNLRTAWAEGHSYKPGTVVADSRNSAMVAVLDGYVVVDHRPLQPGRADVRARAGRLLARLRR